MAIVAVLRCGTINYKPSIRYALRRLYLWLSPKYNKLRLSHSWAAHTQKKADAIFADSNGRGLNKPILLSELNCF